jgi:signal peptidase I
MVDRHRSAKMKNWLRENKGFLFFMFMMVAARSSFADHYLVPSGSMEDTLFPGDRVIVDKRAYGLRIPFTLVKVTRGEAPARGDVIIFDAPDDGTRLIKRIVAVGGDRLEVRGGHVLVNGRPADDKAHLDLRSGGGPDVMPVTVPAGHVFAMGDFRGNSRDSRFFGFVREDTIYAKASHVYYRSGEGFVWKPL